MRERFIEAVVDDAAHSEHDMAGCLRSDVVQDLHNADRFFLYDRPVPDVPRQRSNALAVSQAVAVGTYEI
jgi:hypothetical protein